MKQQYGINNVVAILGLNTTYKELKLIITQYSDSIEKSLNTTYTELKRKIVNGEVYESVSGLNTTYKELKLLY